MRVLTDINFAKHLYARNDESFSISDDIRILAQIPTLLQCIHYFELKCATEFLYIYHSSIPSYTGIPATIDILSNRYSVSLTIWQKSIGSTRKTNVV